MNHPKKYFLILFLLIFSSIHSQNNENNYNIIATGYFLKPLKPNPVLFQIYNTSDTLKVVTNKFDIFNKLIKLEIIESIDVSQDKADSKIGTVTVKIKNESWQNFISIRNQIDSLDMTSVIKTHKDTVYLKNELEQKKYNKLVIGDVSLTIRENGNLYKNNGIQLFIKSDNTKDYTNLAIDYNKAVKIIEPLVSITPHSKGKYSLIYDFSTENISWLAKFTKVSEKGKLNNYGGKSYLNEEGNSTIEIIEINAITGNIITQQIDDNVEIRIR